MIEMMTCMGIAIIAGFLILTTIRLMETSWGSAITGLVAVACVLTAIYKGVVYAYLYLHM